MNWGIALAVAIVVVLLGGVAAVLWWRLANSKAPYADARHGGTRDEHVVVIRDDDAKA